jgi:hypothetical protein
MVEAAGVERDLAGFRKSLMVADFWAKSREISSLAIPADSTHVPSNPLFAAAFLEE